MNDLPATEADNSPIAQFREKVADRIRKDIGDLMPDAMLQEIVKQSIEAELGASIGSDHMGRSKGAWLQTLIRDQIGEKVRTEATRQIGLREKEIRGQMAKAISEQMPDLLAGLLIQILKGQSYNISQAVTNFIINTRNF